eukprot:gene2283-8556_t
MKKAPQDGILSSLIERLVALSQDAAIFSTVQMVRAAPPTVNDHQRPCYALRKSTKDVSETTPQWLKDVPRKPGPPPEGDAKLKAGLFGVGHQHNLILGVTDGVGLGEAPLLFPLSRPQGHQHLSTLMLRREVLGEAPPSPAPRATSTFGHQHLRNFMLQSEVLGEAPPSPAPRATSTLVP